MLEYEFEEVSCGEVYGFYLRETAAHREVILRRAAETYGADNGRRVADSTGLSAASPAAGFASPAPAAEEQPAAAAKEPHFDRDESNEAPSEAELELLQALRSIK